MLAYNRHPRAALQHGGIVKRWYGLVAALSLFILFGSTGTAWAAPSPSKQQRLAVAQTKLLFRFYHGQPQTVSPKHCNQGQAGEGSNGVFLLPSLSFGDGDVTLYCAIRTNKVLVDLGGGVVTEDARDDTYVLADGTVLGYDKQNLHAICNDAIRFFAPSAPAALDGEAITGTPVVTPNFSVHVNRDANDPPAFPYYDDSIAVGHPGRLTACYTGEKRLLKLASGHHVISVDLSNLASGPTHVVYDIKVSQRP